MKSILILEDDRDMQMIYRFMLRGAEALFDIEVAETPARAMELLEKRAFDLIITDIVTGAGDGESFVEAVRKELGERTPPVLVVTVLKREELDGLKGMRGIHFLQKPISGECLGGKIRAILGE